MPLSAQPSEVWVAAFNDYWGKGQKRDVTVSNAVIGCEAAVSGMEIRVHGWAGSGDFETEVRPFVVEAIDYANKNS